MLKFGWSRRDVSIDEPVNIPGQFRVRLSKGILDPIMVNCLVVEDGEDIAIFMSGDFVAGRSIIEDIRAKLTKARSDIPAEKVLFNVTHTHCGAGLDKDPAFARLPHEGIEIFPALEYRDYMSNLAVEAICEAYDTRDEGSFAYGYGYAVVAHSRRVLYSDDWSLRPGAENGANNPLAVDGHAKMYGPTKDENFIGYEGNVDHYINLLYTFDKNDKLTGAIINVPCPSQNSEQEEMLTADYWNEVRELIRKKHGDIHILSQCAAAGDMSPRTLHYKEAEARRYALKFGEVPNAEKLNRPWEMYNRYDIAERIAVAFDEVLEWAKKDKIRDARVQHTVKTIKLPQRLITKDQYEFSKREMQALIDTYVPKTDGTTFERFEDRAKLEAKLNRFRGILARYEEQQKTKTTDMELHVISLGDVAFATNAFELYIDYQHQMQAKSPFTQTFIIQLCDQPEGNRPGYLAHERAIKNHGYSATIYCNQVSPEGGEVLVAETLKELRALHE